MIKILNIQSTQILPKDLPNMVKNNKEYCPKMDNIIAFSKKNGFRKSLRYS
jgi:hypothetical protein